MRSKVVKRILSEASISNSKILEKAIVEHKKKWDSVNSILSFFGAILWFFTIIALFKISPIIGIILLFWSFLGIFSLNFNNSNTIIILPLIIWMLIFALISYLLMKINYPTLAKIRKQKIKKASKI